MANNEVRIIGGQWKGRKLKFSARPALRPTLGRVRETLFNWLAPRIIGTRCLDLYAGSGALGFEALSRGAAEVTFVERDRKAARDLETNLKNLGPLTDQEVNVVTEPANRFLARTEDRYDIIFCDPPFEMDAAEMPLARLLEKRLDRDGVLYLEWPRRSEMPGLGCRVKHSTAGDCQFALLASSGDPSS